MFRRGDGGSPRGRIALLLALFLAASQALAAETVRVGMLFVGAEQRAALNRIKVKFEKAHPGVRVFYVFLHDREYKAEVRTWLASGDGPEVLAWQAGERLHDLARRGLLAPLGDLWRDQGWDSAFTPGMRSALRHAGEDYALPVSHYHWGIYFRKSLLKRLGITPPRNWAELLEAGSALRRAGITPFALGSRDAWTVAAWFDYLDLRINGYQYHRDLLDGRTPYTSGRVRAVFLAWRHLVRAGFFNRDHRQFHWHGVIPRLYHEQAAMLLMGNFATARFERSQRADIGFVPFPAIRPGNSPAEDAPTDLLMIPHYAADNPRARQFLAWFGRSDTQAILNDAMNTIPPHVSAPTSEDRFVRDGVQLLKGPAGLVQFYDREIPQAMVEPALAALVDFLDDPDPDRVTAELEALRLEHYPEAPGH